MRCVMFIVGAARRGSLLLRHHRRGTAATEFAILALPFFILTLGVVEVGYDFFAQAALDNAVQVAARSVQVGTAQRGSNQTVAQFVQTSVCPALGRLLDCSRLYVSVTSVPSGVGQNYVTYLTANPPNLTTITSSKDVVCTGAAGQMMLLQAYYLGPTFLGALIPSFSIKSPVNTGQLVHPSYGAAGFVNEGFAGGESGC